MGANRLLKVVLAAVMVAGPLALGAGVPATAAPSAAASPRLAAWAVTADFPVDDSLVLAVNPQSHTVYAGGQDENEFSVINGVTGKLTGTIPAPAGANQGAVNPATNTLYVSTAQSIVAINAQTGQVIMTIPDSHDPGLPVVDEATNTIYVANASGIWVIDGSTNTVTGTIDLSSRVGGMALDQLTGTLYVADLDSSDVSVINTSTNSVTTTVDVGQFPRFVTVDPVTDKVYVDNQGDHSVSVIDGATNTVTATVDLEAEGGLVADPQTDTIYAADFAGEVRAIDGRTNDIVISLAPGQDFESSDGSLSHGLAIDPAAGILYSIDVFLSSDNPDTTVLSVITSCRGHIALAPGGGCAGVAADFEPAAVSFASPEVGVAVGTVACQGTVCDQATMMETTDGGKSWVFLNTPPDISIESFEPAGDGLLFTSADNGWLFGAWHTRNGGATWQQAAPGDTFFGGGEALAMAASNTSVYEAVRPEAGHGQLFAAPVGAVKWTQVPAVNEDATGLAVSGRSAWVTGPSHLWESADGRKWVRYPSRCPGPRYRLAGVTATSRSDLALLCAHPVVTGPDGPRHVRKEVLVSANGGRTVRLIGAAVGEGVPQGFASPPGDPAFMTIVAAGSTGASTTFFNYHSDNGGKSWATEVINGVSGGSFRSLTYTSRTTGWVVLASPGPNVHNVLLQTTDGGTTWHQVTL